VLAPPSDINLVGSSRDSLDSRFLWCPLGPGCGRRGPGGYRRRGRRFGYTVACVVGNRFDGGFARCEVPSFLRYGIQHGVLRLRTGHPPGFPLSFKRGGISRVEPRAVLTAGFGPAGHSYLAHRCRSYDVRGARWDWADQRRGERIRTLRAPERRGGAPVALPNSIIANVVLWSDQSDPGSLRWGRLPLMRDRLGPSAASVHSGFSSDVCAAEGSSLTGVAHPSAITSSASWRGRSNISSTERCERSMPSRRSANLCVNRISIATEPTLRNEASVCATTTVGNRVVCNGRLHGVQCYLYFIKGRRRLSLI